MKLTENLKMIGVWIVIVSAVGAVIEVLHWAFFEPKPVIAWVAVFAAAVGLTKWVHWETYGRPEEPPEDEKKYAAWFEA